MLQTPSGRKTRMPSDGVDDDVYFDNTLVPREAFEIDRDRVDTSASINIGQVESGTSLSPRATMTSKFTFKRSARTSVLLGMGLAPTDESSEQRDLAMQTIDQYTKASDDTCIMTYQAVIIGNFSLELPKMLAAVGLIPGLAILAAVSAFHGFLVLCIVDLPALVEENLECYVDLGRVTFNQAGWIATWVIATISWFGACTYYYSLAVKYAVTCLVSIMEIIYSKMEWHSGHFDFPAKILTGLLFLLLVLKISARGLHKSAKLAVWAMFGTGLLVVVCSIVQVVADPAVSRHECTPGDVDHTCDTHEAARRPLFGEGRLVDGMQVASNAWSGIGFLPYVLAEMLYVERAKKTMGRAVRQIAGFYAIVAIMGFIGFGTALLQDDLRNLIPSTPYLGFLYHAHDVFIVLKVFGTFPVLFWPLVRELDAYVGLGDAPPVVLHLPWAIKRLHRAKMVMRILLLMAIATVTLLLDSTDIALWLGVPLVIVHMMLPPIFAVASIRIYAQRNPERATRWLFIRTSLVAVGTSILGLAILLDSLGDIWRHFEMVAPR
eukprot:TRINITY_DN65083_c0_g2_i2.p1 TRINITY_DN65083_c0_g2~~TRINITY_DN65083_c0_g2_i2.p1  ORF type:complete len:549 (+),score=80.76 TRINITY_DN65083_c0_g2_i2:142-1788(+)